MTLHILWKAILWFLSHDQQFVSDIPHSVKGSVMTLITSFPTTNSMWVTFHILWKAVSSHLSLLPQEVSDIPHFVKCSLITSSPISNSEWVTFTFCERKSPHIFSYDNRKWVTMHILWKAVSYDQQDVSNIAHFVNCSLIWPTGCVWHCIFCERQSHHIFPMTNRKWVTLHILRKTISSHVFLWPTGCEWQCTFCERQSHHILSHYQQLVSDIAHPMKGSLVTSFPMTIRKCVALHILWKPISSHLFLWPTASEWHSTSCERQPPHHIFSYYQQRVSDIAHFMKGSLMTLITSFYHQQRVSDTAHFVKGCILTYFPITDSEWVTLHILWMAVSSHLFPLPTAGECHSTFCERQSHDSHRILSYHQQPVSVIAHFVNGSFITYFPIHQQLVSGIAHFVKGSLITSFPITNRLWVTLHILWKAPVSFYHQQDVSDIEHLWKVVSSHLFLHTYHQQRVSEIAHFVKSNLITFFSLTNDTYTYHCILCISESKYAAISSPFFLHHIMIHHRL